MSADPYDVAPDWVERHCRTLIPVAVGVVSAVLLAVSFPPLGMPDFAFAFLVPGVFWAYLRPPLRVYGWTLFGAQAAAWTANLWWLHPVTWFGPFLLGPVVGAWTGSWYLAAWWAMPRIVGKTTFVRLLAMLGLAGVWVVLEWTRTWFLGGFPWMPLAATQWQRVSILQVAAYTGAGGISFVIVTVNLAFAAYAHRLLKEGEGGLSRRSQEFLLAAFLILCCLCLFLVEVQPFTGPRFKQPFARVAVVQPYIPAKVKWDPADAPAVVKALIEGTRSAAAARPDLILWPESSTPWAVKGDSSMRSFVEHLSTEARAPLLIGADAIEEGKDGRQSWYNAAFVVDPALGLQTAYYAKRKLVPFGEYVPFRPLLGWLSKVVPVGDDFSPGTDPSPLVIPLKSGAAAFGILICYEDIFPPLAREEVRSGADVLAVLTNDAWYGEGAAAYQHAAQAVLRAVETRRPVLRCGNGGWSGWIDEFGVIRGVATDGKGSVYFRGARHFEVTRDTRWIGKQSFYVAHGDWFVAVCACLAAMAAGLLGAAPLPPKPGDTAQPGPELKALRWP